ncbi:MAG: HDIG domain-containing protein [Candidatus Eiseniibacteriota bacterium]|nr:MAG: HDIG domain-containing protein [Candidatus Eisenbacteria bacterium]
MKLPRRSSHSNKNSLREKKQRTARPRSETFVKRANVAQKLAIGVVFVAAAVLLFPPPVLSPQSEYREGAVSEKQVIAPFEFSILKTDEQYEEEKRLAAESVLPVFSIDERRTSRYMARLAALRQIVERYDVQAGVPLDLSALGDVNLPPEVESVLSTPGLGLQVVKEVERFVARAFEAGVVAAKRPTEVGTYEKVKVTSTKSEFEVPVSQLQDSRAVVARAEREAKSTYRQDPKAASAFVELVRRHVGVNTYYNGAKTDLERADARGSVSRFEGVVLQGEKIIGSHEKITAEHLKKLRSLEHYKRGIGEGVTALERSIPYASRVLVTSLLVFVFACYLRVRRRNILADNHMLLLMGIAVLLVLGLGSLVLNTLKLSPYLVPIVVVPVLVGLLLDDEVALILGVITSALVGTLAGLDLLFFTVSLVAATTAVYAVIGVRQRRQFYRAMLFVAMAYVAAIATAGFSTGVSGSDLIKEAAFGILNSFGSTIIAMACLPVLESTFGLTTNITLLELSDLNRPIVRRMMIDAPGTYHHSMVVGNLAEVAAEAIGANSLLARVASYYHDIGKINKPEYYIENQKDARSRHDRLSPTMSCLILESHVREGVDIAKEQKLPSVIRQIIQEHHGTTLMAFFYQKAREIDSDAPIDEYRYPGPKPSSREAAIIMLADSVEAASRSLSAPTPSRIRGIVKRLIENRATEGELDECGLTMAELAKILASFVPILTSIFHGRPPYPDDVKKRDDGDIRSEQTEKDRHQL